MGAARMGGVSQEESEQAGGGQFRSNLVCLPKSLGLVPRTAGTTEGLEVGE